MAVPMHKERAPLAEVQNSRLNETSTSSKPPASPLKAILTKSSPKKANKAELFNSPAKSLKPIEPLTDPSEDRFTMFPIKYQSIWEFYKKAEASFWTGECSSQQPCMHML